MATAECRVPHVSRGFCFLLIELVATQLYSESSGYSINQTTHSNLELD